MYDKITRVGWRALLTILYFTLLTLVYEQFKEVGLLITIFLVFAIVFSPFWLTDKIKLKIAYARVKIKWIIAVMIGNKKS